MSSLMKLIIFSCVIVCISAAALSDEIYRGDVINDENNDETYDITDEEDPGSDLVRRRRFTCNLPFQSQWLTSPNAFCATKCMFNGKKGGTCENGTCHCHGSWIGRLFG